MSRHFAPTAALLLLIAQASGASATTKDAPVLTKTSTPSCDAPAKATKVAKTAARANRCATGDRSLHIGTVPLVFTVAAVGGIVAIAVDNSGGNTPTSP